MYYNPSYINYAFQHADENQQQGLAYAALYTAVPQNQASRVDLIKTGPMQPVTQPLTQPVTQPVIQLFTQPLIQPVTQPLIQSFTQPLNQPVTQPLNQPVTQPLIQPVTQPLIQTVTQPLNHPVTQPLDQPVTQPFHQPVTQPLQLPVTQPFNQPVIQPLTPPVTQPPEPFVVEQLISPTKKIYKGRMMFGLAILLFLLFIMTMIGLLLWYFLYDQCSTGRKCGSKGGCVRFTQWCDGYKDCPLGEDESQCFRFYGPNSMLQSFSHTDQKWKTVCADNWADTVGKRTCQQMGYNSSDYVSFGTTNAKLSGNYSFLALNPSYPGDSAQFVQGFLTSSVSCQSNFAVSLNCIACGKREDPNPAVPEGEVVTSEGRWPWQVSLKYLNVHRCGGTIITPTWIVTSANCVHKLPGAVNWTVHAGVLNQIDMKNAPGINVTKIVKHPNYDKVTHENDIALMKLNTLLIMSSSVRPVCLPNSGMDISAPRQAYISGWAPVATVPTAPISTLLRQAKITIIDKSVCNGSTMLDGQISDSMVCAGDQKESFPCRGDTGSPLVTEMNSLWWLVGAFSWGDSDSDGCPNPHQPGVYTNVTSYVDWIYEKILEK